MTPPDDPSGIPLPVFACPERVAHPVLAEILAELGERGAVDEPPAAFYEDSPVAPPDDPSGTALPVFARPDRVAHPVLAEILAELREREAADEPPAAFYEDSPDPATPRARHRDGAGPRTRPVAGATS